MPKPAASSPSSISPHCPSVGIGATAALAVGPTGSTMVPFTVQSSSPFCPSITVKLLALPLTLRPLGANQLGAAPALAARSDWGGRTPVELAGVPTVAGYRVLAFYP